MEQTSCSVLPQKFSKRLFLQQCLITFYKTSHLLLPLLLCFFL